jgi:hypothetical protein
VRRIGSRAAAGGAATAGDAGSIEEGAQAQQQQQQQQLQLQLRVIDVGTGAGLPGMVLAVARPHWKVRGSSRLLFCLVRSECRWTGIDVNACICSGQQLPAMHAYGLGDAASILSYNSPQVCWCGLACIALQKDLLAT